MGKIRSCTQIVLVGFCWAVCCHFYACANDDYTLAYEYIDQYKQLAVEEMQRAGVPASIKLSQGILESDYGRSRLARIGNNHFGIKCKNYWKGGKMYHTDDAPDECFRKYPSVYASYRDHSKFLQYHRNGHYSKLFRLGKDYRKWAYGLKKAGYATNPQYPKALIRIIEKYDLDRFDYMTPAELNQSKPQTLASVYSPFPSARAATPPRSYQPPTPAPSSSQHHSYYTVHQQKQYQNNVVIRSQSNYNKQRPSAQTKSKQSGKIVYDPIVVDGRSKHRPVNPYTASRSKTASSSSISKTYTKPSEPAKPVRKVTIEQLRAQGHTKTTANTVTASVSRTHKKKTTPAISETYTKKETPVISQTYTKKAAPSISQTHEKKAALPVSQTHTKKATPAISETYSVSKSNPSTTKSNKIAGKIKAKPTKPAIGVSNETTSVQRYPLAKTEPLYPTQTRTTTPRQPYTPPNNARQQTQRTVTQTPPVQYAPPPVQQQQQPINIRSSAPMPPPPPNNIEEEPLRMPRVAETLPPQQQQPPPVYDAPMQAPNEVFMPPPPIAGQEATPLPVMTTPAETPIMTPPNNLPPPPMEEAQPPIQKVSIESEAANIPPPVAEPSIAPMDNPPATTSTPVKKKKAALKVREGKVNDCNVLWANLALSPAFVAHSYDVPLKKLYIYNDLKPGERFAENAPIYLEAKKRKARKGAEKHTVKEGETMHSISQAYGIQLKTLRKRNLMNQTTREPMAGQQLYLRKRAAEQPRLKK